MQCSKHDILYVMQLELFSKEMHVECWNSSAGSYKWATLKAESLSTEKYHPKKVHSRNGNGRKWYEKKNKKKINKKLYIYIIFYSVDI